MVRSKQVTRAQPSRRPRLREEEHEDPPPPPPPPRVPPAPGFDHIAFHDDAQRTNFLRLAQVPFFASRFLDPHIMRGFDSHDDMTQLFERTGIPSLYGMGELTYRDLTLEFLSSFTYDARNRRVHFRLRNTPYPMTLAEFGTHLGIRGGGLIPTNYNFYPMWRAMTGDTTDTNKYRIVLIQDPRLRLWVKTLVHTLFARAGTDCTNSHELTMLSTALNIDRREEPIHPDVPALVAAHFSRIATGGQTKSIGIGGVVTYLARRVMGFDGSGVQPPVTTTVPLIDREYLYKVQKWLRRHGGRTQWLLKREGKTDIWTNLPERLPDLAPFRPLDLGMTEADEPISFLLQPQAGETSHAAEARAPPTTDARPSRPATEVPDSAGPRSPFEDRWIPTDPTSPGPPSPYHETTTEPLRVPKTEPDTWIPMPRHPSPPRYTAPGFDPYSFESRRYIHDRINRNLEGYKTWDAHVASGLVRPGDAAPSYYRGPTNYPGAVFEEVGVDPASWGPHFGDAYGGAGGQFLPHQWYQGGPGGPPSQGTAAPRTRPAADAGPSRRPGKEPVHTDEVTVEDVVESDEE